MFHSTAFQKSPPMAVVAFGVLVAWWGLKGGPPQDFSDAHG